MHKELMTANLFKTNMKSKQEKKGKGKSETVRGTPEHGTKTRPIAISCVLRAYSDGPTD